MSRWRRQQRKRARHARAQLAVERGDVAALAQARELFDTFERAHPVRARRWLLLYSRNRDRAALAASQALLTGSLPTELSQ